jgi:hypothetical protein
VATNVFNNALDIDLDDYLEPYRFSAAVRLKPDPQVSG